MGGKKYHLTNPNQIQGNFSGTCNKQIGKSAYYTPPGALLYFCGKKSKYHLSNPNQIQGKKNKTRGIKMAILVSIKISGPSSVLEFMELNPFLLKTFS